MTYDQYLVYYDTCVAIQKFNTDLADVITQFVKDTNASTYPRITIKDLDNLAASSHKYAYQIVDPGEYIDKPNLRKLLQLSEANFKARAANLPSSPNLALIKLTPAQFNYLKTGITDDSSSI